MPPASPPSNPAPLRTYRRRYILLVALFVLVAAGVSLWNMQQRHAEHVQQSRNLAEYSVNGAARAIAQELESLRKQVRLFARVEEDLLRSISRSPGDFGKYDQLRGRVKEIFPDAVAVTLADANGQAYVEDFDGYIIDVCKNDIARFAADQHTPEVMIHPNSIAYHFDVMVRLDVDGTPAVFFVSFRPEVIARLLSISQIYGHRLVLIRQDRPGLIEVTVEGSREALKEEEQYYLSDEELGRVAYGMGVEGTAWTLVDVADAGPQEQELSALRGQFAAVLALMVVLAAILVRQLARSETRILEQNDALARHARELERSESRLQRAQDIADMGHWDYSLVTDEVVLSEGVQRMFGLTSQVMRGDALLKLVATPDRARVRSSIMKAIVKRKPYRAEFAIVLPDGRQREVYASAELSRDGEGNPLQLFGIVQDITQRKQAEELARNALIAKSDAESASSAKSAFLANMSHEIRTPLTAIIGFGESLLSGGERIADQRAAVDTIIRNGRHLLQIVNDILDLSKIEAGKLEVERTRCAPLEVISEIEQALRMRAAEKGLAFTVACATPVPRHIVTDALRLKQVLLNLCTNAIKFTTQGSVTLAVACDPAREVMAYTVTDTGVGMTEEQLARVFEPFTQADNSTARKYGGTGLGLSISRQLAELLGGTLAGQSRAGGGSRFTLTLPTGPLNVAELVTDMPQGAPAQVSQAASIVALRGHVLLVEDTDDNQRLISLLLRRMGVSCDLAENGAIAIDRALAQRYDVILMDVQMPVLDGLEATRRLRARGYAGVIVALTANTMKEDQDRARAAGCDNFVSKPIDQLRLHRVMQEYLATATADESAVSALRSAGS